MSIIIRDEEGDFERLDATLFENEDRLQAYITANPEAIPLYELDEGLQLLMLKREVSTDSGRVDVLGIDQKGGIYLIETKLHSNPDKRNVVAQILDYGASLWRHCDDLDDLLRKFGSSDEFRQKIAEHFELEPVGADELFDALDANLKNGVFQFIVLMDKIDPRLKDLILFINQNSQFNIYAVELKYYKKGSLEILAPDLHGAEVKKRVRQTSKDNANTRYADFYQSIRTQLKQAGLNPVGRGGWRGRWRSFQSGYPDVVYATKIAEDEAWVFLSVYGTNEERVYKSLTKQRSKIDTGLGGRVEWLQEEGAWSLIKLRKTMAADDLDNPEAIQQWIVKNLVCLRDTLQPILAAVMKELGITKDDDSD